MMAPFSKGRLEGDLFETDFGESTVSSSSNNIAINIPIKNNKRTHIYKYLR